MLALETFFLSIGYAPAPWRTCDGSTIEAGRAGTSLPTPRGISGLVSSPVWSRAAFFRALRGYPELAVIARRLDAYVHHHWLTPVGEIRRQPKSHPLP